MLKLDVKNVPTSCLFGDHCVEYLQKTSLYTQHRLALLPSSLPSPFSVRLNSWCAAARSKWGGIKKLLLKKCITLDNSNHSQLTENIILSHMQLQLSPLSRYACLATLYCVLPSSSKGVGGGKWNIFSSNKKTGQLMYRSCSTQETGQQNWTL